MRAARKVKPIPEAEKAANKFFKALRKRSQQDSPQGQLPLRFFYKEKTPLIIEGRLVF